MRWLQDSAAGLDLSKKSAILFGHGVGSWLLCHYLLQVPLKVASKAPLFAAVIMQLGFCDDLKAAWCASQSEGLFEPMSRYCTRGGKTVLACLNASDVVLLLNVGGDVLAYCSHWVRPFSY
jgi:hypothetical protein